MKPTFAARHAECASSGGQTCRPVPVLTLGLIATGALTFFIFPEAGRSGAACLPVDDLGMLSLVLLTVAGAFIHPDAGCLLLHLGLLGVFGIPLERRWGSGPVLAAVVLGSLLAGLIRFNLLLDPGGVGAPARLMVPNPAIGFSGVVGGLMGLFVVAVGRTARPVSRGVRYGTWFWHPAVAIGAVIASLFLIRPFADGPVPAATAAQPADGWAWLGAFLAGLVVGMIALALESEADAGPSRGAAPEHQKSGQAANTVCRYRMA